MAKHTRGFVFLTVLLCLVLLVVSPAAHASGSVSEEPACPAVASAVLGARQADILEKVFYRELEESGKLDAQYSTETYCELPRFEQDPLACLTTAIIRSTWDGGWVWTCSEYSAMPGQRTSLVSQVGLADLNFDGVPELLLYDPLPRYRCYVDILDMSDGRLQRVSWGECFNITAFASTTDAAGRQGMCVVMTDYRPVFLEDQVVFLYDDPVNGWRMDSTYWYESTDFDAPVLDRRPCETSVSLNGRPVYDPGGLLYRSLMEQPATLHFVHDGYLLDIANDDGFLVRVENEGGFDGMLLESYYLDLSDWQNAYPMAKQLLQLWNSRPQLQCIPCDTVLDAVLYDWESGNSPY